MANGFVNACDRPRYSTRNSITDALSVVTCAMEGDYCINQEIIASLLCGTPFSLLEQGQKGWEPRPNQSINCHIGHGLCKVEAFHVGPVLSYCHSLIPAAQPIRSDDTYIRSEDIEVSTKNSNSIFHNTFGC